MVFFVFFVAGQVFRFAENWAVDGDEAAGLAAEGGLDLDEEGSSLRVGVAFFTGDAPRFECDALFERAGIKLVTGRSGLSAECEVGDGPVSSAGVDEFRLLFDEVVLDESDEGFDVLQLLGRISCGGGGRESFPQGAELFEGANARTGFAEGFFDESEVLSAESALIGPGFDGGRLVRRIAVAVPPCGFEICAEFHFVLFVKVDDGLFGQLFAFVVRGDREWRERDPVGFEDEVLRNGLCGSEVFCEEVRRHSERLAGVIESFTSSRIRRELRRGSDGDTGQVANGQVVFGVGEAPRKDGAGVSRVLVRLGDKHRFDGGDDGVSLLKGGLLFVLGGHFAAADKIDDAVPAPEVTRDVALIAVAGEVESALGFIGFVAALAVFFGKRNDLILKGICCGALGACGEEERDERKRKGGEEAFHVRRETLLEEAGCFKQATMRTAAS